MAVEVEEEVVLVEVDFEVAGAEDLEVVVVAEDLEVVDVAEAAASEDEEVAEDVDSEVGDDVTVWWIFSSLSTPTPAKKAAFPSSAWPVGRRLWTLPLFVELEWIFSFCYFLYLV